MTIDAAWPYKIIPCCLFLFVLGICPGKMQAQKKRPAQQVRNHLFNNPFNPAVREQPIYPLPSFHPQQPSASGCYDTSARFFLKNDSGVFFNRSPVRTTDGGILIMGTFAQPMNTSAHPGFLMKTDIYGNLLWLRTYDSLNHNNVHTLNYLTAFELADGNILLSGITSGLPGDASLTIFTKTDPLGNIIWNKTYSSRFSPANYAGDYRFTAFQAKQDPASGDVFITGPTWNYGRTVLRMNPANGNIIWSKAYLLPANGSFDTPFGIEVRNNEIRSIGRFEESNGTATVSIYRLNKNNGDTLQTFFYRVTDTPAAKLSFAGADKMSILANGNYAISGRLAGSSETQYNGITPLYHAGVAEIDTNLNFVRAYCFRNRTEIHPYITHTTVFPDGSGLLSMTKLLYTLSSDVFYTQFKNGQILKKRIRHYNGEMNLYEGEMFRLLTGEDMTVQLNLDSATNKTRMAYLRISVSDTASACAGENDPETFIQNYRMEAQPGYLDSVSNQVFDPGPDKTFVMQTRNTVWMPGCQQVAFCNQISIRANEDTLCPGMPVYIRVTKNPECGSLPYFTYPAAVSPVITPVNDSIYQFVFHAPWQGYLYVQPGNCSSVRDSVFITVRPTPVTLNLGNDRVICASNNIVLNAGDGFQNYLWQNGSTDSLFTVTQPGTYFVQATDACNRVFTDTVVVTPHPPIPFELGPDQQICRGDSLSITAPAGFISYLWSPNNAISSVNTQTVTIYPSQNTTYYVSAQLTLGCYAYDSIKVSVLPVPAIHLGADKSICNGDSLMLNAGAGFVQYNWSNGAATQTITVHAAGNYSVAAKTTDGCIARDTFRLISLFPLPVPELGNDSVICTGTPRILNAGTFSSYLWNTGETTPQITVTQTGTYTVRVTSADGCFGYDTLRITKQVNPPAGFLSGDTAICSYGTLTLSALSYYPQYLWSTNAATPSIVVNAPGAYWLRVTDQYHCSAADTVNVRLKDCLKGFYIPSAFTPNRDGLNDTYKPTIFGVVESYSFKIYNRWGALVFSTADLAKGWDGTVKDKPQDNQAFTWYCTFKLKNEQPEIRKGTVLLIR